LESTNVSILDLAQLHFRVFYLFVVLCNVSYVVPNSVLKPFLVCSIHNDLQEYSPSKLGSLSSASRLKVAAIFGWIKGDRVARTRELIPSAESYTLTGSASEVFLCFLS
jgi:hypothetical protein